MKTMIAISLAGAFGAYCRYLCSMWLGKITFKSLPLAILLINWSGSLAFGMVAGISAKYEIVVSKALTVGFLGAFTTFSTFSLEAVQLLTKKQYGVAIIYIILSIAGSIALFSAAYFGIKQS
ncbi:CrcB protein [Anoxybacillus vitaminiphilus]|uniref:Fluoride-specific ion channel FluC n=1 Tax=Paranoxybacillus vitaminiphilus TaxID=581036 RepID=A0A327YTV8_9BACL|nr:fluoride efflux transporter CrcB [Anoxybacillus vitaminiphilus]RAK23175.1 CrcB protein [Anoxybacillus vitaminiphilus]